MSRIRRLARIAVALGCPLVAALVNADTRLTIEHMEPGKPSGTQSVTVSSGNVRMEQNLGGEKTVLLFHQTNATFYAIQPSEKSYMELDPATMDQAAKMRERAMAQLEAQMAQMPEEQREQMKAMMERMGSPGATAAREPLRYEARGDRGTAAGVSCSWYEAHRGDHKVRELCIAPPSSVGMPAEDVATMKAMQSAMQDMAERLGGEGMFLDDFPEGVPVHVRHFDHGGTLSSEQIVQSVSHDAIDGSVFQVPSGYERREMPTINR